MEKASKYRVTVLLEKFGRARNNPLGSSEIVMENSISYDDFKTSNRLYVWLVEAQNKFKQENEKNVEDERQAKLPFKK